jgi:hypothetical protein
MKLLLKCILLISSLGVQADICKDLKKEANANLHNYYFQMLELVKKQQILRNGIAAGKPMFGKKHYRNSVIVGQKAVNAQTKVVYEASNQITETAKVLKEECGTDPESDFQCKKLKDYKNRSLVFEDTLIRPELSLTDCLKLKRSIIK